MTLLTGGCQCGAVRFAVARSELGTASICHCRMCQKAFGAFYAPLVEARGLVWTRGEPARFRSSNHVARGFCPTCGTPLTYEPDDEPPSLAIGAFDDPASIQPTIQYGTERKLPYADTISALPARSTDSTTEPGSFLADIASHQHPDRDTPVWPPAPPAEETP